VVRDGGERLALARRDEGQGPRGTEPAGQAPGEDGAFARNSMSVAGWTAVSRLTGFVRIAVVAAVLGPTYVGNIFQATSSLPMLCYAALSGSLFSSLLVPVLVRHIDAGDRDATRRIASAFLSTALAGFGVAALLLLVAEPWVLRLVSVGVEDPAAAASQQKIGLVLLAMFLPQLLLYAVVGTSEAVVNAHGRFALPNAAPTLENLGIIATMVATAVVFGTGEALASPSTGALLLLGLGTTGAVAVHASVQWWGASRVGVPLLPRFGWQEPEIRAIVRRAGPSVGYSALEVMVPFGGIVVANRVAGGVVAFQFAYLCCTLPLALAARPVGVSLLPHLSRLHHAEQKQRFRDDVVRGAALVAFLAIPAALALVVLAEPIADAVTFGRMATPHGQGLLTLSLASTGASVVGFAALMLGTYVCYARHDAHTPFRAALLRSAIAAVGLVLGLLVPAGGWSLVTLGITISLAELVGGLWLGLRLRATSPRGGESLLRPLMRSSALSAVMLVPAFVVARWLPEVLPRRWNGQVTMLAAGVVGAAVYITLQRRLSSPELALLGRGLPPGLRRLARTASRGRGARRRGARARGARVVRGVSGPAVRGRSRLVVPVTLLAVLGGAAACAPAAGVVPVPLLLVGLAAAGLLVLGYASPPAAAYVLLAGGPLLAGFARNAVLPVLRPHEALALLLGTGVALRALAQMGRGRPVPVTWGRLDLAILLMAVTSSLLPLLWMVTRGLRPGQEDLLYAATLWKFYAVFLLVRVSVRTERQVARCLAVTLGAGVVVGVVAALQSVFGGVADAVFAIYPVDESGGPAGRGTSTLGSSIAVGDVMAFDLAICLAWAVLGRGRHRRLLLLMGAVFAVCGIGSGQVSGVVAVSVAAVAVAVLTGGLRRLAVAVLPTTVVAALLLWPVLTARVSQVDASTGLPQSWWVRLENLHLYVWPQFGSWADWLLGVRPAGVLHVDTPWASEVFIESGHTWLLWTGGVPFALAYLYFTWVSVRTARGVARDGGSACAVAGAGAFAALLVCFVLMTFDPHLTMRGTADLLFSLVALTAVAQRLGRGTEQVQHRGDALSSPLGTIPAPAGLRQPAPATGPWAYRVRTASAGSPGPIE
jgi:putative peptidoglycan lipid II flippase